MLALWSRASGRCEFSGIPFNSEFNGSGQARAFHPSIDRIDSRKGYTFKNCRLVCAAVNFALRDFDDDVLDRICRERVRKIAGEGGMVGAVGFEPTT